MFDINLIRNDFPMIKNNDGVIYFDNAATTFKPVDVINSVSDYYNKLTSNIHRGDYDTSFTVSKAYDKTRDTIKKFINASNSKEIVFTSGATESLNTIAFGYIAKHINKGDVILTTLVEHSSSILPLFRLQELTGCEIRYIPLNENGTFNLKEYEKCFEDGKVKFVCMAYVSNVLGYVYPVKEIINIAHKNNAVVSLDGAQAVPHIKVDVQDIDVDFLSFSAHKMLGTTGVGVLYGKFNLLEDTDPLMLGGGANARFNLNGSYLLKNTPEKFEAGTPNIEGVLGLNEAAQYLMMVGMDNVENHDKELVKYMIDELMKLDNIIVYNPLSDCGIVSFNVKGVFAQDAGSYLNKHGICVRTGNHCAKLIHSVIGVTETIRASVYLYNTKEEIDKFIAVCKNITLENCIGVII